MQTTQNPDLGTAMKALDFGTHAGLPLPGILDPLGRLFQPSPYNIPQFPHEVTQFSVLMIMAMIDTGRISSDVFHDEKKYYDFIERLKDLRNHLQFQGEANPQPPGHADDGEWILYEPEKIIAAGRLISINTIYEKGTHAIVLREDPPKLPFRHRLIAVVRVKAEKRKSWTVAFEASSVTGRYHLSTICPNGWYRIRLFSVDERKLQPWKPKIPPPFV
ncbi:MAG: hypothetical protein A2751_05220 [Candidatus Doudnabacteria bacterium RIFCSPHIGHO2_01_FULL_46_14]|uniref:Uncharacterized protein n=1 Tax=Candidatus Doudnabacteria bacterium RIFCSPHIGHO2_01_FULL_46_14 TaxID=1817824 RepID=A0A1F5NNY5_9BACT|nr:MAG: hypothetical protein A2751_05220 [Candidatus Doudnabacteria bacterium RIFCSPHIGHO2_01_FULL_46_14]